MTSTYKDNLEGYTVQLENTHTAEYRDAERQAARLAGEIEGNVTSRANVELENGDEEEAFSAVHRPPPAAMRQVLHSMTSSPTQKHENDICFFCRTHMRVASTFHPEEGQAVETPPPAHNRTSQILNRQPIQVLTEIRLRHKGHIQPLFFYL